MPQLHKYTIYYPGQPVKTVEAETVVHHKDHWGFVKYGVEFMVLPFMGANGIGGWTITSTLEPPDESTPVVDDGEPSII